MEEDPYASRAMTRGDDQGSCCHGYTLEQDSQRVNTYHDRRVSALGHMAGMFFFGMLNPLFLGVDYSIRFHKHRCAQMLYLSILSYVTFGLVILWFMFSRDNPLTYCMPNHKRYSEVEGSLDEAPSFLRSIPISKQPEAAAVDVALESFWEEARFTPSAAFSDRNVRDCKTARSSKFLRDILTKDPKHPAILDRTDRWQWGDEYTERSLQRINNKPYYVHIQKPFEEITDNYRDMILDGYENHEMEDFISHLKRVPEVKSPRAQVINVCTFSFEYLGIWLAAGIDLLAAVQDLFPEKCSRAPYKHEGITVYFWMMVFLTVVVLFVCIGTQCYCINRSQETILEYLKARELFHQDKAERKQGVEMARRKRSLSV